MGSINGITAERMLVIESENIISGSVVGNSLILVKHDGTTINCGSVTGSALPPNSPVLGYTYVCTSSTRPGSPSVGQMIYETDTGAELVYYGATTGWKPPWQKSWGRLALPDTSNLRTSIAGTPTITDTDLSVTFNQTLNRIIKVTCFGQVQTAAAVATFQTMVLYLRDSANTVLNTTSIVNKESAYSNGVNFTHVYTAASTGSLTLKLSATRSAGSDVQYFGARTSIYAADPFTTGTAYMLVEDVGPATANAPAA